MASLCYFLVSSYRSALFSLSKCNLGSISSLLICPPAAEHTLQRNMKENSRRGLKTNKRPVCKKKLGNYNKCEFSNFFLFQWPKMIISVFCYMDDSRLQFGCQSCSVVLVVRFRSIPKCPIFCSFADTEFRSDKIRKF